MNYYQVLRQQFVDRLTIHISFSSIANKLLFAAMQLKYVIAVALFFMVLMSPPLTSLAMSPVANAKTVPTTQVVTRTDAETYYIQAVNALRAKQQLPALTIDSRLSLSAAQKTSDMITQNYWGHYAPTGTSFADYVWASSPAAYRVGENLARCFATRDEAFAALVASPTHYAIMTGEFTNFGVAEQLDTASGCIYTTMHFSFYN